MYDELVEALRLCVKYGKGADVLANALKAADAIEELSKKRESACWGCKCEKIEPSRWIPVTERLPDIGSSCLISPVSGCVAEGQYDGDGWTQYRWSAKLDKDAVTHWMPMPEPPKEAT